MQRTGLAGIEPFIEVVGVPQVEIAHLRPLDAADPEELPRLHAEGAGVARGNPQLADLFGRRAGAPVEPQVRFRQPLRRVDDHRRAGARGFGVPGRPVLGVVRFHRGSFRWRSTFAMHARVVERFPDWEGPRGFC